MPRLEWDKTGEKTYRTGVEYGVLYPISDSGTYPKGVAWNGITNITESPSGADATKYYADNNEYASVRAKETFGGSISAYMFPDEWYACDGSAELVPGVRVRQQNRQSFGLSYQTGVGNDTQGMDYGYIIHLVYGATASPSDQSNDSINDSPDISEMSWDFETTPVEMPNDLQKTSHIEIDSRKLSNDKLETLIDILRGSESSVARLPLPTELYRILSDDSSDT